MIPSNNPQASHNSKDLTSCGVPVFSHISASIRPCTFARLLPGNPQNTSVKQPRNRIWPRSVSGESVGNDLESGCLGPEVKELITKCTQKQKNQTKNVFSVYLALVVELLKPSIFICKIQAL